jgi:hypothetical protein
MTSVFISHSSVDDVVAARVRDLLARAGFASIFLDFDPDSGIAAARRWEEELRSEIRKADVVVFLATKASVNSKWCHAELVLAREFGRTILPVLLEPNARSAIVADVQEVRAVPANGHVLEQRLVDALRKLTLDPRFALPWDSSKSPYPGLHPFDEDRAGVFYGRDAEIARALQRLTGPRGDTSERFVVVVGASGSGKSSLVRAGVLPRLRRSEGTWVVVEPVVPGLKALDQLADALARASGGAVSGDRCRERVAAGDLPALVRELWERGDGGSLRGGVVITIDQAEKLALEPGTHRVELLDGLTAALDAYPPLHVVATLREEYLTRVIAGTRLGGQPMTTIPLEPLSPERLADVIVKPAERAGLRFGPGLVGRMVAATTAGVPSGGDPLPLLAFTLQRLFDSRGERAMITADDYDRVGGVAGALRAEADAVYERLAQTRGADAVVGTLLELVHSEPDDPLPAARTVERDRFDTDEWDVVQAFVEARLLTAGGAGPSVTVAHEALLRDWPVLSSAIAKDRDRLVARTRLERAAKEWDAGGRKAADLLSPERLKVARRVAADDSAWASDDVLVAFLAASRRHVRRSRATTFAVAAAIVLAVATVVGGAWLAYDYVREQRRIADARGEQVRVGTVSIDRREVTYRRYRLCVSEGRCARLLSTAGVPPFDAAPAADPVLYLNAPTADRFCAWIGMRLPSRRELLAATEQIEHLLDPDASGSTLIGGQEWTSTAALKNQRWTVYRNPKTHEAHALTADATQPELYGFRCATR